MALLTILDQRASFFVLAVAMLIMGLCLGGLHHLLCVTCAADIGTSLQGRKGTSTVTGIIDGLGSLGTSIG